MIRFRNENENSAGNFNSVSMNWVKFYFSYETCVGIRLREFFNNKQIYVHENDWSATTGKHLNWLDRWEKEERLSREDFDTVLREAYRQVGLLPNENM